jgi:hypothetical protein
MDRHQRVLRMERVVGKRVLRMVWMDRQERVLRHKWILWLVWMEWMDGTERVLRLERVVGKRVLWMVGMVGSIWA